MKPSAALTIILSRMLPSSRALRLNWLVVILVLQHFGSAHGQSIGAVSARQEGETIIITVLELTDLEVEDLTYFYSMDSGKNWIEIAKNCLEFEGADARWAVLDCMNTEAFEGSALQFKVDFSSCRPVRFDGYEYRVVKIGNQCWFAENLRTSVYVNGDVIRGRLSERKWPVTNSGAQAVYNSSNSNLNSFGRLYNGSAVIDPRGLCPSGWHVPSDKEWTELTDYLGGRSLAGNQMKSSPSNTPSWDGSNTSGFSGLPGGTRYFNGSFYYIGSFACWWSSSHGGDGLWGRNIHSNGGNVDRTSYDRRFGLSVRCVRD